MADGDAARAQIYETIGTYLGYGVAHFADFYDFQHVLVLGRVTSGPGGDIIVDGAREVLDVEFPELAARSRFTCPTSRTSATARRSPPPACPRSRMSS